MYNISIFEEPRARQFSRRPVIRSGGLRSSRILAGVPSGEGITFQRKYKALRNEVETAVTFPEVTGPVWYNLSRRDTDFHFLRGDSINKCISIFKELRAPIFSTLCYSSKRTSSRILAGVSLERESRSGKNTECFETKSTRW